MQEQIIQEKDEPPVTGVTAPATKKLGPNRGGTLKNPEVRELPDQIRKIRGN